MRIQWIFECCIGLCLLSCQANTTSLDERSHDFSSQLSERPLHTESDFLQIRSSAPMAEHLTTIFYFDKESFAIDDVNKKLLISVATYLKEYPQQKILLVGNSDLYGPHEYNQVLGQKRATTIMNYLESLGIPKNQMRTISRGKENPLSLSDNEQAQAINRRVEIFFEKI